MFFCGAFVGSVSTALLAWLLRPALRRCFADGEPAFFVYTNWEGKTSRRAALPLYLWYGESQWHQGEQWFLHAFDCDKNAERDFAMRSIAAWE
jgi:predicted DNA-binding transcriptional regulator YafY